MRNLQEKMASVKLRDEAREGGGWCYGSDVRATLGKRGGMSRRMKERRERRERAVARVAHGDHAKTWYYIDDALFSVDRSFVLNSNNTPRV